ncbi:hypothetical protein VNO78_04917 [Psophocarpus tetragonolobus]|uniref:Uncharacterized protein n=1 Tax=Psophocarpus tetragonolobus TaxID=3891 RepID=A0AAN9SYY6_PSOTE
MRFTYCLRWLIVILSLPKNIANARHGIFMLAKIITIIRIDCIYTKSKKYYSIPPEAVTASILYISPPRASTSHSNLAILNASKYRTDLPGLHAQEQKPWGIQKVTTKND